MAMAKQVVLYQFKCIYKWRYCGCYFVITVYAMLIEVFWAFLTSIFIHQFFINISLWVFKNKYCDFWDREAG